MEPAQIIQYFKRLPYNERKEVVSGFLKALSFDDPTAALGINFSSGISLYYLIIC